jgi:hypothetical protein
MGGAAISVAIVRVELSVLGLLLGLMSPGCEPPS